jgi:hypothetical protein
MFNKRQSSVEGILDIRLPQLDSGLARISKEEAMTDVFKNNIEELNNFCFDLQNCKVSTISFEERAIDLYADIRKLRIQFDSLDNRIKELSQINEDSGLPGHADQINSIHQKGKLGKSKFNNKEKFKSERDRYFF